MSDLADRPLYKQGQMIMKNKLPECEKEHRRLERHLEKIAPQIGYIAMAFNELEDTLDTVLVQYFVDDIEEIGMAVIEGRSFSDKVNLFNRLYSWTINAMEEKERIIILEDLVRDIREAARLRNMVIHAAWQEYHVTTKSISRKKFKGKEGIQISQEVVSVQHLKKHIRFIDNVSERLYDFNEMCF
jgi:hypothetical protein